MFCGQTVAAFRQSKTAYLAELEVESGKLKLKAGKSYKEDINALMYAIDIIYLQANGVCKLRTSKLEIHQQVYNR